MRFFLTIMVSILCLPFLMAGQAIAQNCDVVPEMIAKLRKPELGSYNLWDHVEGDLIQKDRYVSGALVAETGHIIMARERFSSERDSKVLLLQELDRRGRSEWLKEIALENMVRAVKVMTWKDELVVLADLKKGQESYIWVGFFTMQGDLKRENTIRDKKFSLSVRDAVSAHDGENLLLLLQSTPRNFSAAPSTILYWVNDKGSAVKDRAFMLGLKNTVSRIIPMRDKRYVMAGAIETADGRMAGWIVYMDQDGSLRWQRQYARGRSSRFFDVASYQNGRFLALVGDAFPGGVDGGRRSGWVMIADINDGEPAWQRYYREDADVYGRAVHAADDGQVTVMMDLQNMDEKDVNDYVRVVTLNPRGVILSSRSYQNGVGANAVGMVIGNKNEPVIYGSTMMVYTEEKVEPDGFKHEQTVRTKEAWALAAAANNIYDDPCVQPYRFLP